MDKCHVCGKVDNRPTYPDPCCNAPDCDNRTDVVHYECASQYVKREIEDYLDHYDENGNFR